MRKENKFKLFSYGLRSEIKDTIKIYSVEELEKIKNSVIILDEVMNLWDLDDRKIKRQIEHSLRLIHHNNNILIISAVPENIKKFISSKLNFIIFKRVTIEDFINGSSVKRTLLNYTGNERGYKMLNLGINEAIIYDGNHYNKIKVPYYSKLDTKRKNKTIFEKRPEFRPSKCEKSVLNNAENINISIKSEDAFGFGGKSL